MPKTFKSFTIRPEAETDLENIWAYGTKTWSLEIAAAYYDQMISGLNDLLAGLKAIQDVSPVRAGYFRIKVGVHHIYFTEEGGNIDIVRILHERMNPSLHL